MIATVGQLWFNPILNKILVVTEIQGSIIHFHYLNNPDGKNGRHSNLFYSLFQPYVAETGIKNDMVEKKSA